MIYITRGVQKLARNNQFFYSQTLLSWTEGYLTVPNILAVVEVYAHKFPRYDYAEY